MIKLIDLEGWSDYSISPYINQLKQLSESPEITPTKGRNYTGFLQFNKNWNVMKFRIINQDILQIENKQDIKSLVKKGNLKNQQNNTLESNKLSSFVESPKKPKMKELQDCLFQRRSYRLKIKNKMLNLTQKSPLKNISQLLRKLNSEVINKNDLVQILDK